MPPAPSVRISTFRPGRPRPMSGQLRQRLPGDGDVVGGGVRPGVPGPQHHRQRLPGAVRAVVDERPQRMEPEPAFERGRRVFLLRVRGDQGGVEVDDQRPAASAAWSGASHRPTPTPAPGLAAGRCDRRQRLRRISGETVDQPGHRRVRGDRAKHARLGAQQRDVGQAVTTQRQRDRQIQHDLARIVPGTAACATRQRRRQARSRPADRAARPAGPRPPATPHAAHRR